MNTFFNDPLKQYHQDYGYWYQNGVLYPNLVSVFIALDPSTNDNGCLQVIKGSHLLGRVDHVLTGEQSGADLERVNEALNRLELVCIVPIRISQKIPDGPWCAVVMPKAENFKP